MRNKEVHEHIDVNILKTPLYEPFISQRILAEISVHSLGVVNRSIKNLTSNGYLDESIYPTLKVRKYLAVSSPKNAIILGFRVWYEDIRL